MFLLLIQFQMYLEQEIYRLFLFLRIIDNRYLNVVQMNIEKDLAGCRLYKSQSN